MYCVKCGAEIPDGLQVCPKCGQKFETHGVRTIRLKCKSCNALMDIDENEKEVVCPYCGAREWILDSDEVTVQKIKSSTQKEMEFAKMENENRKAAHQEEKEEQKNYRKSKLCVITLIFTFISLVMMISSFMSHHILSGIIATFQTGLFVVSWLMGMHIIEDKKRVLHVALAMLGFLLLIPFMLCNNGKDLNKLNWPAHGLAVQLPDPKAKYGDVIIDDVDKLYVSVDKYTDKDYENYLNACQKMGYALDSEESGSSYIAHNEDGYKLLLSYYTDSMNIELNAPGTYDRENEVDMENKTDTEMKKNDEEQKSENATETEPKIEEKPKNDSERNDKTKVDPDLKAFLDEYEDFVDKYVEFMKKYQKNSTDPDMAADYVELLKKYNDFATKLTKYDEETMSDEDAAYYAKVTIRCSKKLDEAALDIGK